MYPQQKRAYSALHPQAWTYIYSSMSVGMYWVQSLGFPKIVYLNIVQTIILSLTFTVHKTGVKFA